MLGLAFAGLFSAGTYAQSQDATPRQANIQSDKKDIRNDKKDLRQDRGDRNADQREPVEHERVGQVDGSRQCERPADQAEQPGACENEYAGAARVGPSPGDQ
jgi:hypothetical protein